MGTFRTAKTIRPRVAGETAKRTLEDRKDFMYEQMRKGYARKFVVDDPEHCLRWNYGHWEVYVTYHKKAEYVGCAMDRAQAVELRKLALWYKDNLVAEEEKALRAGIPRASFTPPEALVREYEHRYEALHEAIILKNRALKHEKLLAKHESLRALPAAQAKVARGAPRDELALTPAASSDAIRSPAEQAAFERSQIEGMVASAKAGRHEVEGA